MFWRNKSVPAPEPAKTWYDDVPRDARQPTLFGIGALVVALLGFSLWGSLAPITSAVVTSGVFVTTGQNKIVQHLEGGIIRDILVKEGDVVEPDQVLIQLDDTAPKAELRRLSLKQARLHAAVARLTAEAEGSTEISLSPDLVAVAANDPDIAAQVAGQRLTFEARRSNMRSDVATLQAGIDGLRESIQGSQTQLEATRTQLELIEEELEGKAHLLRSGMIRKPEVLAVQRARANLNGEVGRLVGQIGDAKERIARTEEQIRGVRNTVVKTALEQLDDVRGELNDVGERIRASKGILDRVRITAPVRGVVVKLRYHTSGGVVEAGKSIMEIVPISEALVVEVRVRPQDIDHVRINQAAAVRLTALSQRVTPMVNGEVIYVSADALPDDRKPGTDNYIARVKVNLPEITALKEFVPTAGMPAEVYIKTGERSFFEYLIKPLKDSMSRAFRES